MRGIVNSGHRQLAYVVEGQGRPALVVGSATYYPRTFSPALRQQLLMVFADHLGFAPADDVKLPPSLDQVVEDLERTRKAVGLERFVLMGHSGHGYIALEYARRHPERVSHLVMIGTGPSHSDEMRALTEHRWATVADDERVQRFAADMQTLPLALEAEPHRRFVHFCLKMAARSWKDPTFDASDLWAGVDVDMPAIDHLWGEAFRDYDTKSALADVSCPILIAMGRFDYLVPPLEAWLPLVIERPNVTLQLFELSAHSPQLEEPREFDDRLLNWLRATDAMSDTSEH